MSLLPHWSVFDYHLLEERPGFVAVLFEGHSAAQIFRNEAGGHRWQRIPPNEKRGRVHTSTVTVAVLDPEVITKTVALRPQDLDFQTVRGSGAGGQHRNKTESCVVASHRPTGLQAKVDGRSQHLNKQAAIALLSARVGQLQTSEKVGQRAELRRQQVGSGMRGDKIRTYRQQDDLVSDHRLGRTWRLKDWLRGHWD